MQPTIELAKSSNTLNKLTFVLLYACDFADRLEKEIIPALKAGFIVLADRYIYTAIARAGVRGVDSQWIRRALRLRDRAASRLLPEDRRRRARAPRARSRRHGLLGIGHGHEGRRRHLRQLPDLPAAAAQGVRGDGRRVRVPRARRPQVRRQSSRTSCAGRSASSSKGRTRSASSAHDGPDRRRRRVLPRIRPPGYTNFTQPKPARHRSSARVGGDDGERVVPSGRRHAARRRRPAAPRRRGARSRCDVERPELLLRRQARADRHLDRRCGRTWSPRSSGRPGCGKSTFLRTLNRMNDIVPGARVEGRVRIDGAEHLRAGHRRRRAPAAGRHGVSEVEPVPEVDLRERRVRPADQRHGAEPARPRRARRGQPAPPRSGTR